MDGQMKNRKTSATAYLNGDTVYLIIQGMPYLDPQTGARRYGRVRVSTGVELRGTGWNDKKELPRDQDKAVEVKAQLARLDQAYVDARKEGRLTPERVRELFEGGPVLPFDMVLMNRGHMMETYIPNPNPEIDAYFEKLKKEAVLREESLTLKGGGYKLADILLDVAGQVKAASGRKQYASFRNKVLAECPDVMMHEIDEAWRRWFYGVLEVKYKLQENTMWGQQKYLNRAINYARDEKGVEMKVKSKSKYRLTPADTDYLDWQDLSNLIKFKIKADREDTRQRLEDARTNIMTYCLTSIRISDTWKFYDSVKVRNGILCASFRCTKPPHPLVMPIVWKPLKRQLEISGVPKHRAESNIRTDINDLLDLVGIDKHISPHCGRRSFITNFLQAAPEIPDRIICSVFTGHSLSGASSDRKVFEGYNQARVSADQTLFLRLIKKVDRSLTGGIDLI